MHYDAVSISDISESWLVRTWLFCFTPFKTDKGVTQHRQVSVVDNFQNTS